MSRLFAVPSRLCLLDRRSAEIARPAPLKLTQIERKVPDRGPDPAPLTCLHVVETRDDIGLRTKRDHVRGEQRTPRGIVDGPVTQRSSARNQFSTATRVGAMVSFISLRRLPPSATKPSPGR